MERSSLEPKFSGAMRPCAVRGAVCTIAATQACLAIAMALAESRGGKK